jgi:aquaporin Z
MIEFNAKFFAEMIGTFVFFLAIFAVGQPLPVAVGLLLAIYVFGGVSGGHFNATVTATKFLSGDASFTQLVSYLVAQLAGGIGAYYVAKSVVSA